jgi:hypothetical protein
LVNFCIGLFTDKAAEWAATEKFKIPDSANTSEEVLAALIDMVKGAFKDVTIVSLARSKPTRNANTGLSSDTHRYYDRYLLSFDVIGWTNLVTFRFKAVYVGGPAENEITTCRKMHNNDNSDNSDTDGK